MPADDSTVRAENALAGLTRRPKHEHEQARANIAQVIRWYRRSPGAPLPEEGGTDGAPRPA